MDINAILRDGTVDLTGNETLTSFHLGYMRVPLYLHVLVPEVSTDDTLDVELEFCEEGTLTQVFNINMPQIDEAGHYSQGFFSHGNHDLQVKLVLTGADPDFGATRLWLEPVGVV